MRSTDVGKPERMDTQNQVNKRFSLSTLKQGPERGRRSWKMGDGFEAALL